MATDAEIAVLEALAAQGESLEWKTPAGAPRFRSRLRLVDRQRRMLLLDRCADEAANRALLALPRVEFQIEWGEWRIKFVAANPMPVALEGAAAIRLDFPDAVEIARWRIYERAPDPLPPLRCVGQVGDATIFDAVVRDVSPGGIGLEIDFAAGELEPGTILVGCRLGCPGSDPVEVDLEVRHTIMEPHGARVVSAGCRFVNLSPAALVLIAEYVHAKPPVD